MKVYAIADGLDGFDPNRPTGSAVFGYDSLNRLVTAQSTGTDCATVGGGSKNWGNSYTVDAWGNLTTKTVTKCSAETLTETALIDNHLSGHAYDLAGNMKDNRYSYDAESRIVGVGTDLAYAYDADGNRVQKFAFGGQPGALYFAGSTSDALTETSLTGTVSADYIFFGGKRVARIDPGTPETVKYYISDHLGSSTVIANASGNKVAETMYFPYGGERWTSGSDSNHYKFTGKERDTETGLDYFGARYYGSNMGRWMSPDWAAHPIAVPYADFGDPQTLNLYGYVRSNPLSHADADGHCCDTLKKVFSDVKTYVKSVAYAQVSGGIGIGAGARLGPVKVELSARNVIETTQNSTESTKKDVREIKAQAELGPAKIGPGVRSERTLMKDNAPADASKSDTSIQLATEGAKGGLSQSGWDVGVGASLGVGLQGSFEIGFDAKQVLSDFKAMMDLAPRTPIEPRVDPPARYSIQ